MNIKGEEVLYNWKWYVRQILPLTYRSHYVEMNGKKYFTVWRMWFGRCFDIDKVETVK